MYQGMLLETAGCNDRVNTPAAGERILSFHFIF